MKNFKTYITEKLKIKKQVYTVSPTSKEELVAAIKATIDENGNNCSLNHIDISKLDELDNLFAAELYDEETYDLENWDGDISKWNVSNITSMKNLFWCSKFSGKYGDISDWDVSKVEDMSGLFNNSRYNGDISDWDVSSVENMDCMFWGIGNEADDFDPEKFDLSKWNVSNVTDMTDVFAYSNFNGDISKWNTGNVIRMTGMFRGTKFNGDISKWNIHNVKFMNIMFTDSEFDGDISGWNIKNVKDTTMMFDDCPIKKEHKPGYVKLSELEKNIKNNNKPAIKDFIMNLLTKHGNKTANEYTLNFGYLVSGFWNSVPEGFSYIKSKDKLYVKMYWQGDKTDGYEMLTFDEVWSGDFNFYVHTNEKMLSERDTFIEVLKALDKKYK